MTNKYSNIRYPLIMLIVAYLVGCANILPKTQGVIEEGPVSGVFNLNFPEIDPVTGKRFEFDAEKYNFSDQIVALSKYKKASKNAYDSAVDYNGIGTNKKGNLYEIFYAKGRYFPNIRRTYATKIVFVANSKLESDGNLSFTLDSNFSIEPMESVFGLEFPPLDSLQNLKSDVINIFSKLSSSEVSQRYTYNLEGDINVEFSPESVYANFDRLLGKYEWGRSESIKEFKKENTYKLSMNNKDFPVNVEIYPYRNGAKVIYKAKLDYEISSNGNSTLVSKDIETLKEIIESTAKN
ncbi:MAG: hypothetical protein RBR53_07110 [Desulforegulaceae bacterium]|nr:hypothetical protein [Desulforegulaceae bacterium]